jgi:nucleoside-diphosphate-sugar epimerase
MRIFVTGASGFIGTAVTAELIGAGHQVVGLARSDAAAAALADAGAAPRRGSLDDLDGLREAAGTSDGVIHLAFKHDAMRSGDFPGAIAADLRAIHTIGDALVGSGKPLVAASATLLLAGLARVATEADALAHGPRIDAENTVIALAERGVRSSIVRLPPTVHSARERHGFTATLIAIAREKGVAGYVGDGSNRWPAVHALDAARLFRRALETAPAGSRLHAVADEGVPFRRIAETIGRHLNLPAASIPPGEADAHFGFLGPFVPLDNPVSSARTRDLLGWVPTHPGLIDDLDQGHYFGTPAT